MKNKTELEEFREKFNLPKGAEKLDPSACTCGKTNCQEHETWGEYLLNQIFEEGDKPIPTTDFDKYLPAPKYDAVIYSGKFTERDWDKHLDRLKATFATIEDVETKTRAYYDIWMRRRSGNEFSVYAEAQRQELHTEGTSRNGFITCTCSLITDLPATSKPEELWQYPGHITHPSKEVVNVFCVESESENEFHIWCRNCGDLGLAKLTKSGKASGSAVRKVRSSHACTE